VKDINGGELRQGGMAMLLCEVLAIEDGGVRVRVMNSELEIVVGTKHDEVLDGMVADSELTAFEPAESVEDKISRALQAAEPRIVATAIANFKEMQEMSIPPCTKVNAIAGDTAVRGGLL
jgi:hypothetical protein